MDWGNPDSKSNAPLVPRTANSKRCGNKWPLRNRLRDFSTSQVCFKNLCSFSYKISHFRVGSKKTLSHSIPTSYTAGLTTVSQVDRRTEFLVHFITELALVALFDIVQIQARIWVFLSQYPHSVIATNTKKISCFSKYEWFCGTLTIPLLWRCEIQWKMHQLSAIGRGLFSLWKNLKFAS